MKFDVLGREVDVQWDHLYIAAGSLLFWAFLVGIATVLFLVLSDSTIIETMNISLAISWFFGIFIIPLLSFTMLYVAGLFNKKKDVRLCRSLAGAEFIITVILFIIAALLSFIYFIIDLSDFVLIASFIISQIGILLSFAFGSIILYLWLLFFLNPNLEKIKKIGTLALIFAIVVILGSEILSFLMAYQSNNIYAITFSSGTFATLVKDFLFGFIVLYHIRGKKFDRSVYPILVLYFAPGIMSLVSVFLYQYTGPIVIIIPSSIIQEIIYLVESLFALFILYLLKATKLK